MYNARIMDFPLYPVLFTDNIRCLFVTGSVKTRHNGSSLNFQYKPLITMGKYLHNCKKFVKLLNALLFVTKGSNDNNLDITLFAYSKGVQNLCFVTVD